MPRLHWIRRSALLPVVLLLACARDASGPAHPSVQFAKGGGGGGVAVKSTSPASSQQGVTLDVRVFGSGFDAGSRVSFALNGVASSKVVANATAFVSATELVANVTVAPDADTLRYDVVVLTSSGKKGIGSELFAVEGDPGATWLLPLDASALSFGSDGRYPTSDGYSAYQDKVCGVNARIFATNNASGSGDGTIQTDNPRHLDRKCGARKVTLKYPDGVTETITLSANANFLQSPTSSIPIGQTVKRGLNLGTNGSSRCGNLRFKAVDHAGALIAGDSVLVTRLDGSTWEISSQPYPDNRAHCRDTNQSLHMNVRFRVQSAWPLP